MTKIALSIAGFDPSGGAGVLADVNAFTACGLYGMAVVTALTVQDSIKVHSLAPVDPKTVGEQIEKLLSDFQIDVIKIGMLANTQTVQRVGLCLQGIKIPVVLDPVLVSTSGHPLLEDEGVDALLSGLMPHVHLITPNLPEAEQLTGLTIQNQGDMELAALNLREKGALSGVIKGGHLEETANDLYFDEKGFHWLESKRIESVEVHGTGCVFASVAAAQLALGKPELQAVKIAKEYVAKGILNSIRPGSGSGLIHHLRNESGIKSGGIP